MNQKIESTDEAWDSGALGASEQHARAASDGIQNAVEAATGMQSISIRLPKELVEAYKLIAAYHRLGYQPLMRDMLQRQIPDLMREVMEHHKNRASEVEAQMVKWQQAA
jgi:predicted DNA binding CopG/RHH family protein